MKSKTDDPIQKTLMICIDRIYKFFLISVAISLVAWLLVAIFCYNVSGFFAILGATWNGAWCREVVYAVSFWLCFAIGVLSTGLIYALLALWWHRRTRLDSAIRGSRFATQD